MRIVQIIPVTGSGGTVPYALIGLDDSGRVWYGLFQGGHADTFYGGIAWRLIDQSIQ